jgi:hypothetical protein
MSGSRLMLSLAALSDSNNRADQIRVDNVTP